MEVIRESLYENEDIEGSTTVTEISQSKGSREDGDDGRNPITVLSNIENVNIPKPQESKIPVLNGKRKRSISEADIENEDPHTSVLSNTLVNRLVGMNQQLQDQPKETIKLDVHDVHDPKVKASHIQEAIDIEISRKLDLEKQFKELNLALDHLEQEVKYTQRHNNKLLSKIIEIKNSIIINARKFETMEESVMNNVMNKEKLLNFQIRDFNAQLENEFNDFKRDVCSELDSARQYKDDEGILLIKSLEEKKLALLERLDHLEKEAKLKIEQEIEQQDSAINQLHKTKKDQADVLSKDVKSRESTIKNLKDQLGNQQTDYEAIVKDNDTITASVSELEHFTDNHVTIKTDLTQEIHKLEDKYNNLKETEEDRIKSLETVQKRRDNIFKKYQKNENTLLFLENSIFDQETNVRVYANTKQSASNNSIIVNDRQYNFHKVLDDYQNDQICNELHFFIYSSMKKKVDSSVVLLGDVKRNLFEDIMVYLYEQMKDAHQISCQAIKVDNHATLDLFDSCKPVDTEFKQLKSQQMIVDDLEILRTITENIEPAGCAVFYKFQIDTHTFDVVDMTHIIKSGQLLYPSLSKYLDSTRCFKLINLDDFNEPSINILGSCSL